MYKHVHKQDYVGSRLAMDDDTSTDLMPFCMQLVHHSQWTSRRKFFGSSFVEIPLQRDIGKQFAVNSDKLDIDAMVFDSFHHAFNRSVTLPETYTGGIIRIYTDDVHTGYARLIREKDNTELLLSDFCSPNEDEMRHGPAILTDNKLNILKYKYGLSDSTIDGSRSAINNLISVDVVYAVHSPYWPVEATEWIIRTRSHGFPSNSVTKRIVRYGCDFVQVSHNRLSNNNKWRFSFSKAELFIIKSWSSSQRIVYTSLWVLNKKMASGNLCTYYFKTLMFWACEEKPAEFWCEDILIQSFCELLIEMMTWVKLKFCANYFIRGNNIMDHMIDKDLSYEIDALWRNLQSDQLISMLVETCGICEYASANVACHIESNAWINRGYVIYWRVNNLVDNYADLFCTDLPTVLQNALYT